MSTATVGGAAPASSKPAAPAIPGHAWRALVVLLLGMFIALLDTTIVNVALPTIKSSLNASESTLSWIISGYALAFGLALIPAGRIGDRIGHKWVYFTGILIFTAASFACGISQSDEQLVIFRVIQGLAGGIFVPAVTAFIQLLFPPQARGRAFAIMGSVIGVSSALGPIVGGLLIQAFGDTNGWRTVFYVNLPIGLATLILAAIWLPKRDVNAPRPPAGLDWFGVFLVSAALVAILVPLIQGQQDGWPLWTYLTIALGVVLLAVFGLWEVHVARAGRSPLVPPALFRHPQFTGGVVLALVYFAAFTSIFFTISLLWQTGLQHTALASGVVTIPFAVGSILGSSQSGRLAARLGRTVLIIGTALVAAGLIAVWLILVIVKATDLTNWMLVAPLFFAGVGNGFFIAPNAQFIVATVDRRDAGSASAVIAAVQRVGSAVGIAVIGSVLFGSLVVAKTSAPTSHTPAAIAAVKKQALDNLATGFGDASAKAMLVSVIFAIVAFGLVFALPKRVGVPGAPGGHGRGASGGAPGGAAGAPAGADAPAGAGAPAGTGAPAGADAGSTRSSEPQPQGAGAGAHPADSPASGRAPGHGAHAADPAHPAEPSPSHGHHVAEHPHGAHAAPVEPDSRHQ